ncbi:MULTISPECIES: DUF3616 domain-containing protein [unclassified Bradyrhizobium]|uniref:DUF3616 domain-containing protein n=1 Tax=unclassified Bradyrhizobium TaxID=2631580 RepID=UPI002FEF4771
MAAALFLAGSVFGTTSCVAKEQESWPVKRKLLGKQGKKSKDVSGIACKTDRDFPRSCLVIDDNLQDAQFVRVKDGELVAGRPVKLTDNTFKGEPLELDGEGVAFAKGRYYVIGSHGHPRDKQYELDPKRDDEKIRARIFASSQIVRFRPAGDKAIDIERSARLKEVFASDRDLAPVVDQRLEENGLTVEGIAIKDDRLFAGLRGPVLDGNRAVVVAVDIDMLFGGTGTAHRLFRLSLGEGRGVRDLASFGELILILAGPVADGPGSYAVYSWDGDSENVKLLSELSFSRSRKPEALLPLEKRGSKLRVLIVFDGDKEGAPTPVNVAAP